MNAMKRFYQALRLNIGQAVPLQIGGPLEQPCVMACDHTPYASAIPLSAWVAQNKVEQHVWDIQLSFTYCSTNGADGRA